MIHRIQRQYIHVDLLGSESEGFALQNRLSDLCNGWLQTAMEQVFDRCAPAGKHLCIERLEIDAGTLSFDDDDQNLTAAVVRALEKALLEQVPPGESFAATANTNDANSHFKSEWQMALEALLYFLETGRLPWSFRLPTGVLLEELLLDKSNGSSKIQQLPTYYLQELALLLKNAQVRQRLVLQFSDEFKAVLLRQISPALDAAIQRVFTAIRQSSGTSSAELERSLWAAAFKNGALDAATVVAVALAAKPSHIPFALPLLKDVLRPALPTFVQSFMDYSGADFQALKPVFSNQLNAVFAPLPPAIQTLLKIDPIKADSSQELEAKTNPLDTTRKTTPAMAETSAITNIPEEGIYVDNAGLVILHPFLQLFLEGLGIAIEGALTQPDRALHLLHFLGTGLTPAHEYELVLPKILCNLPLDNPVDSNIVLTEQEKEEAIRLLEAAIRHWDALGNTSPDGLRGAFLCRSGKISRREDGDLLLQVEKQSFDILLDRLPWVIGVVKLPWMEGMLWVEWG